MRLRFEKKYWIGISIAVVILALDILMFIKFKPFAIQRWFYPGVILAVTVGWIQFWIDFFNEQKRQKEIEIKFLEFIRGIVETVKSGISIPSSIRQMATKDFGALTPYVKKLARQTEWGIPIHTALITFANDTRNDVIKRSVSIIIEADESGGNIEDVLMSVSDSVLIVKKMKEERKSGAYTQIVQGYIVYFVFIAIMLVLQLWLFPKLTGVGEGLGGSLGMLGLGGGGEEQMNLDMIFFSLIMIQGFFAGIMIGKFSEGTIKQGLLHSLILITMAALIITTAKGGI